MVNILSLAAQENSLHIEANENGWARLTLIGEEHIYLGADSIEVIASRLLNYLRSGDVLGRASAGEMNGYRVACLLLLSEAHHALYVASSGSDRLLFWQNAHSSPVFLAGVMRLSASQRRQWTQSLIGSLGEANVPQLVSR